MSHTPTPVELPQTGPMRWVHAVALGLDEQTATATIHVDAAHRFVSGGHLMPSALIEIMAQTAAAGTVVKMNRSGQRVCRGLLAAIPEFHIEAPVPVPCTLVVIARQQKSLGRLSQAALEVHRAQQLIARAVMTFHIETD